MSIIYSNYTSLFTILRIIIKKILRGFSIFLEDRSEVKLDKLGNPEFEEKQTKVTENEDEDIEVVVLNDDEDEKEK